MQNGNIGLSALLITLTGVAAAACSTSERAVERVEPSTASATQSAGLARNAVGQIRSLMTIDVPASPVRPFDRSPQVKGPRTLLEPSLVERFDRQSGWVVPVLPAAARKAVIHPAEIRLPAKANGAFLLRDEDSGMQVEVALEGASDSVAETSDGYVVYRDGYGRGRHVLHRASATGTEDYVVFPEKPEKEELRYSVHLGEKVAGLRLVANVLEFLDSGGVPRLRMAAPYLVTPESGHIPAATALEGCKASGDPEAPWGKAPMQPGSDKCAIVLSWKNVSVPYVVDPGWQSSGTMSVKRTDHGSFLLPTGKILVFGGDAGGTSELFDPSNSVFSLSGTMTEVRSQPAIAILADGKVVAIGGERSGSLATAEYYEAGIWHKIQTNMKETRAGATAVPISATKILVVGGGSQLGVPLKSALILDMVNQTWTATTQAPNTARWLPEATALTGGKILVTGGMVDASTYTASAELYDPTTDKWETIDSMSAPRLGHGSVALSGNRALVVGGNIDPKGFQVYDANTSVKKWITTGAMSTNRYYFGLVVLPDESVMAIGGYIVNGNDKTDSVELWSSGSSWTTIQHMTTQRGSLAATIVPSTGLILVTGGGEPILSESYTLSKLGEACLAGVPAQCNSGICTDGVCCDKPCTGKCESCKVAGKEGTCTPIPSGQDPDNECANQTADTCGTTGFCNGGGTCALYNTTTTCKADSCDTSSNVLSKYLCDGQGKCNSSTASCGAFKCKSTADACFASCTTVSECVAGAWCDAGTCKSAFDQGHGCAKGAECKSGNCVDNVCCSSTSCSSCQICNNASSLGNCSPKPDDTSCGVDDCSATMDFTKKVCKTGQCVTVAKECPNALKCDPNNETCLSICASDAQCATGFYCKSGACLPKKLQGEGCTLSNECTANLSCLNDVCCSGTCGECEACNIAPNVGKCSPRPENTPCGKADCSETMIFTAGACKSGICTTLPQECPGGFKCNPVTEACRISCADDIQCADGFYCTGGTCVAKKALGKPCTTGTECANQNCRDGYCCGSTCTGACEKCSLAGQEGTCTPVNTPVPEHGGCVDLNDGCGGKCDGKSACSYATANASCGVASCSQGIERKGFCTAEHKCAEKSQDCKEFACGTDACLSKCTKPGNSECGPEYYCDVSSGKCLGGLGLGAVCETAQACTSKVCDAVAKKCCDISCDGDCSTGTCKTKVTTTNNNVDTGSGGCGCRITSHRTSNSALVVSSLLGLALLARRRRGLHRRA